MINFLVHLATDGVYRSHFQSHYIHFLRVPDSLWHSCASSLIQTWTLIYTIHSYHTHKHVTGSYLPFYLYHLLVISCHFSALKTQCDVENGSESCLKWGTLVYKKHTHFLKYFRKGWLRLWDITAFYSFFYSHMMPVFVKPSKVFLSAILNIAKERIRSLEMLNRIKACHSHFFI